MTCDDVMYDVMCDDVMYDVMCDDVMCDGRVMLRVMRL